MASAAKDLNAQLIWLLGIPHLDDYLAFVRDRVVGGDEVEPRRLADEWRVANDVFHELEKSEAGDADKISTRPLGKKLAQLAAEVKQSAHFAAMFDTVPVDIEMVELDRLIVCQTEVADQFSKKHGKMLGADAAPAALFRFCMALDRELPPVEIRRINSELYHFVSQSTDLRAHRPALLAPSQIMGVNSIGPVAAALGLMVGFTPNFLSAIRSDQRILLHNGYHRAYALRALGFTHAPCVVETVTRKDELVAIANSNVSADPSFYFRAARPPMLRDFFNPKLRKRLKVRPIETVVEVKFSMSSWNSTTLTR